MSRRVSFGVHKESPRRSLLILRESICDFIQSYPSSRSKDMDKAIVESGILRQRWLKIHPKNSEATPFIKLHFDKSGLFVLLLTFDFNEFWTDYVDSLEAVKSRIRENLPGIEIDPSKLAPYLSQIVFHGDDATSCTSLLHRGEERMDLVAEGKMSIVSIKWPFLLQKLNSQQALILTREHLTVPFMLYAQHMQQVVGALVKTLQAKDRDIFELASMLAYLKPKRHNETAPFDKNVFERQIIDDLSTLKVRQDSLIQGVDRIPEHRYTALMESIIRGTKPVATSFSQSTTGSVSQSVSSLEDLSTEEDFVVDLTATQTQSQPFSSPSTSQPHHSLIVDKSTEPKKIKKRKLL